MKERPSEAVVRPTDRFFQMFLEMLVSDGGFCVFVFWGGEYGSLRQKPVVNIKFVLFLL